MNYTHDNRKTQNPGNGYCDGINWQRRRNMQCRYDKDILLIFIIRNNKSKLFLNTIHDAWPFIWKEQYESSFQRCQIGLNRPNDSREEVENMERLFITSRQRL